MAAMPKGSVEEQVKENVSQCRHHWLIDGPAGPASKGVCRLCGAQRQFSNYLERTLWEREPALSEPVHPPLASLGLGSIEESDEEG
ncbi:hypothetical protein ACFLX9_02385 [Chloroflexota bacterium]